MFLFLFFCVAFSIASVVLCCGRYPSTYCMFLYGRAYGFGFLGSSLRLLFRFLPSLFFLFKEFHLCLFYFASISPRSGWFSEAISDALGFGLGYTYTVGWIQ